MSRFRVFVRDSPQITAPISVNDDFNRSVAGSWGTTENPSLPWQSMFGDNTYFAVSSGAATQIAQAVNHRVVNWLDVQHINYRINTTVSVSTAATGAVHEFRVYGSMSSGESNKYWLKVNIDSAGVITADIRKTVADVETRISSSTVTISGITYTPGMKLAVQFTRNDGNLFGTIWKDGEPRPASQVSAFNEWSITTPGGVGVSSKLNTGYTGSVPVNFSFYSFTVSDPSSTSFASMALIGELDSYSEISMTPRCNDVGAWSLNIPADHEQADLLRPGRGIVAFLDNGGSDPIFSGPIRSFKVTGDEENPGSGSIQVSGPCDNIYLDSRLLGAKHDLSEESSLLLPTDPPSIKTPGSSSTRDPINSAEFIWQIIHDSMRAGFYDTDIPFIYPASDLMPVELTALAGDNLWKAYVGVRMVSLRDVVFPLAEAAGLKVELRWRQVPPSSVDGYYRNSIYVSISGIEDASNTVVFGNQAGNLVSWEITSEAPTATRVVMGGETSALGLRYFQRNTNNLFNPTGWQDAFGKDQYGNALDPDDFSDPYWGRSQIEVDWGMSAEAFVDTRDAGWPYQPGFEWLHSLAPQPGSNVDIKFQQQALVNLVDLGPKGLITLNVADSPSMRFGVDYQVGDIVRVLIDTRVLPSGMVPADGVLVDRVREVTLSNQADDLWHIKPVVGSGDSSPTPWVYRKLKSLQAKVADLSSREEPGETTDTTPVQPFLDIDFSVAGATYRPKAGQSFKLIVDPGDPINGLANHPGVPVDVDSDEVEIQFSTTGYSWTSVPSQQIVKDSTSNRWTYTTSVATTGDTNYYFRARVSKSGVDSDWSSLLRISITQGTFNASGTLTLTTPAQGVYKPGTTIMLTGTDTTYGDLKVEELLSTGWNDVTDVNDARITYSGTTYQIPYELGVANNPIRVTSMKDGGFTVVKSSNQVTITRAV